MTDRPPAPSRDPYAAFREPGVLRFLLGSLLLQVGMGAQGMAIGWDIYQRTGEALSLGLVGGVQAIPMLLLSLPAGWLADRFERRTIIALCLSGVVLCSLGLAWLSWSKGSLSLIYLLLLLDATLRTLQRPASTALFPTLVPPALLENAMKWRTSSVQVSGMAGPALGAIIIAISVPSAYVACAIAALSFIILLLSLPLKPSPAAAGAMSLASVLAGLRFVWSQKVLLAAVSLDMFAVMLGGATYLLPIYAKDILHVGETGFGLLRAAPAIGAFAMAVLLAHLPPLRRAGRTMLLAVAGFGVATVIFGCSRVFWLSWAMLVLTGALDNISVVVRHTMIQLLTPDAMRGRVSAVNNIFIGSSNEVGGFRSGLMAHAFTPLIAVVSGGIGTLVVIGLWGALFPRLRRFGSLSDVSTEDTTERPAATRA